MSHHVQVGARAVGLGFTIALACMPEAGPVAEGEGSSGSETDTNTSAPETDSGETDETGEPVCHDQSSDSEFPEPIDCELAQPCPSVVFPYEAFECSVPAYDTAAAACTIDALRAGMPGFYRLQDCGGGKYNIETRLQVFDDKTVLAYQRRNSCGAQQEYRETWRTLPDPAYFDACDITTGAGFGECIEGILDQPCVPGEPSCP
jgi:hypothetical protein